MDMIDLYVQEVGRRLPEKNRADIEKEIHSLIEDALEDKSQALGRAPDEAMTMDVLQQMGSPEKIAASYLPPQYLIGPELFPAFITTLKIVLSVVIVLAAIGFGVSLGWAASLPADLAKGILQGALQVADSVFRAFAVVVLIFAILQWTSPELSKYLRNKPWNPRQMKAEPDPERVKRVECGFEAFFSLLAIVMFNQFAQWIGFSNVVNGVWVHAPVLTQTFFQYLPWLSILWVLEAGLDVVLISSGRWTTITRWLAVGLAVFSIVVNVWMLAGPSIVALDPAACARLGWAVPDPATMQTANGAFSTAIRIALGIAVATKGLELVRHLYKLLLRNRIPTVYISS